MSHRNPDDFEPTRLLVMNRGARLLGHDLGQHAAVRIVGNPGTEPGEVDEATARRLWTNGSLDYADEVVATPVEDRRTGLERQITVEELGGSWYLITAPWLTEPAKVQGQTAVEPERQRVLEEALADADLAPVPNAPDGLTEGGTGGLSLAVAEVGNNGWYEISGPGLAEPIKVRGLEAAEAKKAEIELAVRSGKSLDQAAGGPDNPIEHAEGEVEPD